MTSAAKRKSSFLPGLAALRLVLLLVVALCLPETRVWDFAITPQPASGVFESANPLSIGEFMTAIGYDASDSLHAARGAITIAAGLRISPNRVTAPGEAFGKKSAEWNVSIAREMKRTTTATNPWLTTALAMGRWQWATRVEYAILSRPLKI